MALERFRSVRRRCIRGRASARERRSRGMAMVEMIFVLPVLLLLIFAIAEFSLMFSRWLTLSNAVREGARELVEFRSPCNAGQVETDVRDTVISYAASGGVSLAPGDVQVTGACGGEGTPGTVQADFDFVLNVPFAKSLGTINLDYSSQMRNE